MVAASDVGFGLFGLAALAAIVCGILYLAGVIGTSRESVKPAPATVSVQPPGVPASAGPLVPPAPATVVNAMTAVPAPQTARCELAAGGFCPSNLTCARGGTPNAACVPAKIRRKEVLEYSCAGCGALGGGAHQCCRSCDENRALAAKRAPPFDSKEYRDQEVRCPQCDAIMRTKEEQCIVASDGRFACRNGAACDVPMTRTYED
jgi:hypothetical protein